MPQKLDLLGQTFGSLTAVEELHYKEVNGVLKRGHYYRCICSCGGEPIVSAGDLRRSVRKCSMCSSNNVKNELEGKVISTKKFGDFKVIKYNNSTDIEVEFIETGYRTTAAAKEVRLGKVKDVLKKNVYGIGFLGDGPYEGTFINKNGKCANSPAYETWIGILKRCYSENPKSFVKHKPYLFVSVCKEWLNFQVFAKWFYKNLPSYENYALDKDLKIVGSKEYSPDSCSFVPDAVNSLFTGYVERDLPRGVHFCNTKQKYIAQLHEGAKTAGGKKKQTYLGTYNTPEPAIEAYRKAKIQHVKEVADKHKDSIHPDVYNNLVNNTLELIKHID